jgi:uncharacterized protein involved in exopolysaccharide biosynthesis
MSGGGEITISELFGKIGAGVKYICSRWKLVLAFSLFSALLGLAYSVFRKTHYSAISTFVLEENSKMGALSQYAGLASLAGIDLNTGGGGLFQGENILELYKSRGMIEKALLSDTDFDGRNQQLIERYIDFNKLRAKWRSRDDIQNISFTGNPDKFSRTQDSIITDIVKQFNKKMLSVNKLDKKLDIIVVAFTSTDEQFAQAFTNKLVGTVNNFYVQTKTKKSAQNVQVLQRQADSVRAVLNSSIGGVASAIEATPNANPQLLSLRVGSQRKQVDVQASGAVYGEIIKNLEIAKISLRQDIPLIQSIDKPVLPLENDRVGKLKGLIFGLLIGLFIISCFLVIKQAINV